MANPFQKYRGFCNPWRSWSRRVWAIAAAALALIILTFSRSTKYSSVDNKASPSASPYANWVPFTPLSNASKKGAFCLDGSVPGYHIQKGFGSGSQNWVLHIEGGGWCNTIASCSSRKRTALGSSNYMAAEVQFSGILSRDPLQNPDFFDWNKVKIRYCDGASLSGHRESEFENGTELFFRGQLIWEALMDDLLSIGLSSARQAILTGCSAGGLATLIHCDDFRDVIPKNANVKCLADAGFFLNDYCHLYRARARVLQENSKDVTGNHTIEQFYYDVVRLQGVEKSLNKDCLSRVEPHKFFFPQEFLKYIKTPVFLVNPAYDFWQIQNILVPAASDPQKSWLRCKLNIFNCSPGQMEFLEGFQKILLSRLSEFQQNEEGGMFINSCFAHCQTWKAETWHSPTSPRINNKTIAESVGDWYFNRNPAKHIDCRFPCNPTCYNLDFSQGL